MTSTPSTTTPVRHVFERRVLEEAKPTKTEINFIVLDFLINGGYPEAAKRFAAEANIQRAVGDVEYIQERVHIRDAVISGNIQQAIEQINDLAPQLLDRNITLHFSLLHLQLVELIRGCTANSNADITPILEFASTRLSPIASTSPAFLAQLERTMALLIFPPNNLTPALAGLLDPVLRQTVAEDVNAALLEEMDHSGQARLKGLVRLRAWAGRKAKENKIPTTSEGLELFGPSSNDVNGRDGEDSYMSSQ